MSWSILCAGKAENLLKEIERQAATYSFPDSQRELAEAVPSLKALVALNVGEFAVELNASGHATFDKDGNKLNGNATVTIRPIYGFVS